MVATSERVAVRPPVVQTVAPVETREIPKATVALLLDHGDPRQALPKEFIAGLERERIRSKTFSSLKEAETQLAKFHPDIILISDRFHRRLPARRIEAIRKLRELTQTPIVLVEDKNDTEANILGAFRSGADHYERYAANPEAVAAHIHAILRRYHTQPEKKSRVIQFGDLTVDLESREVVRGGEQPIPLSAHEIRILEILAESNHTIVAEDIFRKVWGIDPKDDADLNRIRGLVSRLRKKIAPKNTNADYIKATRTVGYRLNREPQK